MRTTLTCGALLCLATQALAAPPEPPAAGAPPTDDAASGYCEQVRGESGAEAALQLAPELFTSIGVVNAGEAGGGTALGKPKPRLTAGVGYDFVGIYRGTTLRHRAEAECRRYRALSALQTAVQQGTRLGESAALEARARALEASLPQAEQLVTALRGDMRDGNATLEELNAVQLRLDTLRAMASDTARARERLAVQPSLPEGRPLSALMEEYRAADDEVEVLSGGLRRANAWQLSLRGGYDEIFDVEQEVPLSGQLLLSYNLGNLWQGSANARAREGRRRAAVEAVDGAPRRVRELLAELRATQRSEETRLRDVSALLKDLEGQLAEVERLETRQIRRFRDYLLLELARLRAEQAYLRAHVGSLQTFLGAEGP